MAKQGTGFFDRKGNYFRKPEEATIADLAALLGQIGDGESLAPGIAYTILDRRKEIERLFAEHDEMLIEQKPLAGRARSTAGESVEAPARPCASVIRSPIL